MRPVRPTLAGSLLLLSACSAAPPQPGLPALRTSADEASQRELQQVLSSALNGVQVTLAPDAFTTTSRLSIEPTRKDRLGQAPEPGRIYEPPRQFELVIDGSQCFLVDGDTELRWLLNDTDCEAR